MSDELKHLIIKLLDKEQSTRLGSTNDADEVVEHPWFKDVDWEGLMNKTVDLPFKPDMEALKKKKNEDEEEEKESKDDEQELKDSQQQDLEFKINHNTELQESDMDLISLAMDEKKDIIDQEKQKLIEKHKNKFKDF